MKISKKKPTENIIVTCGSGSGPIYLARTLAKKHKVFIVDGSEQGVAPHLGFPFAKIPFGNSEKFVPALTSLIKKWNIDCIVPCADEELLGALELSQKLGVTSVIPQNPEFIERCLNKRRLMEELSKEGISELRGFSKRSDVLYPAVAKPNRGRGSREMHIIKDKDQLEGYFKLYGRFWDDVLVQPHIGGDEYTVSVIVNDVNAIIGIVPKKVISKRGITRVAMSDSNRKIQVACERIVAVFNPRGPFNVQLKWCNGEVYIFEINPRLSTTAVLTDRAFGHEVELYLKHRGRKSIANPPKLKKGIYLYRYEENVFK